MDLIFFLYVLTLVASLCLPILLFYHMHGLKHPSTNLPPGKMGWPIMGETLEYISLARDGKPEKFILDRMEKYSSAIFKTSLLGDNVVVFCGPACNKFLFSSENKFVAGWWPSTVQKLFGKPSSSLSLSLSESSNSKKIKELREFLPPFLKIESLKKYAPLMDSMTMQYLEKNWRNKQEVVVFNETKNFVLGIACRIFLNIKDPHHIARIAKSFTTVLAGLVSLPLDFPSTTFHRAIKATKVLQAEIVPIIRERRVQILEKGNAVGNNDILSHMLHVRSNEGKSANDSQIANDIIQLLAASHETTSSAITFTLKHLADHPHVYCKVFEEQAEIAKSKGANELLNWEDIQKMKYTWNVACETLRLTPPSPGAFREAITEFTYAGFTIPKGWKIHWNVYATNRDSKYFLNPDKFDPSRFEGEGPLPYTFVPFGGGPRMCPGKEYARMVILIFLYHVVNKFKWETLVPNEKITFGTGPFPQVGYPIRLQPYKNC